jgi:quercetin dioxygenase-like cupin family protein
MKYLDKEEFEKNNIFKTGSFNEYFKSYFTGDSFLNFLVNPKECPVFLANVSFEPGCRNYWHIHESKSGGGQMLLCTAGEGWYQEEGKKVVSLQEGSFIYIPANVKHWHGAKKDSWFSHISIEIPGEDKKNVWLDQVKNEYYESLKDTSVSSKINFDYSNLNTKKEIKKANMFKMGMYNFPLKKYFSGRSYMKMITFPGRVPLFLSNITFEPTCRNNWHIHHASKDGGQLLLCTQGQGWYQAEGQDPVSLSPGSVVYIPANVKHWHGAKKDSWFSHIAIAIPGQDSSVEWCEPVATSDYNKLV